MKYSVDQNKIIAEYSKHLLTCDDSDTAMALLIRDAMYEMDVKTVSMKNRLTLTSIFQDMMDAVNPHAGNIFSAFDIDFYEADSESRPGECTGFMIRFMNEFAEIQNDIYRDEIVLDYNNRSK